MSQKIADVRLSLDQVANLAIHLRGNNTLHLVGAPGIGKTSMLRKVAARLGMSACLIDCASLDLGELAMPYFEEVEVDGVKKKVVGFGPNRRFGFHLGQPVAVLLDEFGKSNELVRTALAPLLLEHRIADFQLPEGSLVIAASNQDTDGLGDAIPAHLANRIMEIGVRSPNHEEWIKWAQETADNVTPELIGFAQMTPLLFQEYTEGEAAANNPYIFNPGRGMTRRFVSPRSLWSINEVSRLYAKGVIDVEQFTAAVTGACGAACAADFQVSIDLGNKMPTLAKLMESQDAFDAGVREVKAMMAGAPLLAVNLALTVQTRDECTVAIQCLAALHADEMVQLFVALLSRRKGTAEARTSEAYIKQMRRTSDMVSEMRKLTAAA